MRRARIDGGLLLVGLAVAITVAACFPTAPPPTTASLSLSPSPVDYGFHALNALQGAGMPIITVRR